LKLWQLHHSLFAVDRNFVDGRHGHIQAFHSGRIQLHYHPLFLSLSSHHLLIHRRFLNTLQGLLLLQHFQRL
jgi:hypothetical protein